MIRDQFKEVVKNYLLSEADAPDAPATPDPSQDQSGEQMPDPSTGGQMTNDELGGLGGMVGGMDPTGGMGGLGQDQPQGGQGGNNDICSKKYVALVSYLCELYNLNVSSKKNTVLNLKVKVGETRTLNNVHNSDEVFHFMVHNFLEEDVIEDVKKSIKKADESIKKMQSSGEMEGKTVHNVTSAFLIDVVTCAYYAVCMRAIGEDLPDINYGITKDFPVDPKNAKAVFDEINMNVDRANKLSEIEEG